MTKEEEKDEKLIVDMQKAANQFKMNRSYLRLGMMQLEAIIGMKEELYASFVFLAKDFPTIAKEDLEKFRRLMTELKGWHDC